MNLLKDKNILIVDDEDLLLEILQDEFELEGATVTKASNGERAFELAQKYPFDAVITDVRMAGGDGISLLKKIHSQLQKKPAIFICTGFRDISEPEAKALGVIEIFDKPFNRKRMIQSVSAALKS